ncbi:hypothetical protein CC2G_001397 [Coprinopsis cinerea AmutBmut pab1-1]|nr:hypothetical protein CC2G_001397 [Coprinopsis cinerea AmutBmut pab1-1]
MEYSAGSRPVSRNQFIVEDAWTKPTTSTSRHNHQPVASSSRNPAAPSRAGRSSPPSASPSPPWAGNFLGRIPPAAKITPVPPVPPSATSAWLPPAPQEPSGTTIRSTHPPAAFQDSNPFLVQQDSSNVLQTWTWPLADDSTLTGFSTDNPNSNGVATTTPTKKPLWQQYGGFYRPIDDVSKPWQPSPAPSSPLPVPNAPVYVQDQKAPGLSGTVRTQHHSTPPQTPARGPQVAITTVNNNSTPTPVYQLTLQNQGSPARSEESGSSSASSGVLSGSWVPLPLPVVRVGNEGRGRPRAGSVPTILEREEEEEGRRERKGLQRRLTGSKWKKRVIGWLGSDSRKKRDDESSIVSVETKVKGDKLKVKVPAPLVMDEPVAAPSPPAPPTLPDRVKPHEWKEWGYYARPYIRGVQVYNTPSPYLAPLGSVESQVNYQVQHISETNLTPSQVFDSLVGPDGLTPHPENWKLGMEHPSLPPRPKRWAEYPDPAKPLPFPWEVQLNPFLEHILYGVPRMYWDIRCDISACQHGIPNDTRCRPLLPADLSQPASYPFLTHLYINALADDISPKFQWPIMVSNPYGVKVRDVVSSIYENFQEYVFEKEFWGWGLTRRREASKARRERCDPEGVNAWGLELGVMPGGRDDRMRRIDYLGGKTLFRGLAPNPDATGWVLYLGQD